MLPSAENNNTLLGIDFLEKAGIVLNLAQRVFSFVDRPREYFKFISSPAPLEVPDLDSGGPEGKIIPSISEPGPSATATEKTGGSPFIDWIEECAKYLSATHG